MLGRELASVRVETIAREISSIPMRARLAAGALTIASYTLLTGYDGLAFRWLRHPLGHARVSLASFVGFVFSHNVGFSFLGGNAVRYRILTSFGVEAGDVARVVTFNVMTFWLGFLALGGTVLTVSPLALPAELHAPLADTRVLGLGMLAALAAALAFSALRREPLRLLALEWVLPSPRWMLAQAALSAADWSLACAVLWMLLPSGSQLPFSTLLGAYLLAQVVALVSHVPGGLGVFEGSMVVLLRPWLPAHAVLGAAIAYRLTYYVAPLVAGVALFGGYEAALRRHWITASREAIARWMPEVIPRAFSVALLLAGVVLLLSGATPAGAGRAGLVARILPLPAIELSHLLGSVVGVGLLILARALQQRLDGAYVLSLAGLGLGAVASLAKGLDWEEAMLLSATFLALVPCRRFFYRRSSLLEESFSPEWIVGIGIVLLGTLAVTLFAYRHVEYSHALWWQFEVEGHAPRSLRALLGASLALSALALYRLLRPAPPDVPLPSSSDLAQIRPLIAAASRSDAHLALLGDKRILLHESGTGFVMYGIEGRSWIAMGDPIGPPDVRRELAWRFRELADAHGGRASFYQVRASELPVYLDLGLTLRKLGEEARVPLAEFSIEGSKRAKLRNARSRMAREGCQFEVVPPECVKPLLGELEAISSEWLTDKTTREKRFSVGRFDATYLSSTPLALIRRGDELVAFANLWLGGGGEELSIDLMRYGRNAPPTTMDALFVELMLWGREQGFAWFSLGMAPFSGLEHRRLAPLWSRFGALLFRHGEHFYNFRGLREFKEKFDPVWEPRYLAAPGVLAMPAVLSRVASLVNGGIVGAVAR